MSQSFRERVRPWDCPACEKSRISANLSECPRCHEPRYGSTAAPGSKVMGFWERNKPWQCAVCGQKNISATSGECPKCHTPRAGTAAARAEDVSGQVVRVYEGEKALQEGIRLMLSQGWRVVSQSSHQPPAGVGRVAALGVGALVFKPPVKTTVMFERAAQ